MSQPIATLIKQKLATIDTRKSEKPGDGAHTLQVLADYSLYFQGAGDVAKALGADGAEASMLQRAADLVNAEADAVERRLALEAELN